MADASTNTAFFDRIAHRYDFLNTLMTWGLLPSWYGYQLRALQPFIMHPVGEMPKVLDVSTATGAAPLAITRAYPTADIVGLDPSEHMLSVGQRKIDALGGVPNVSLLRGQAEELPFEDASFDAVCMSFSLRTVKDTRVALGEIARVLKPEGGLILLEPTAPAQSIFGRALTFYMTRVLPWIGGFFTGPAGYHALRQSMEACVNPEEHQALILASGFDHVEVRRLQLGVAHLYVATKA